jgi:hypothetical protein
MQLLWLVQVDDKLLGAQKNAIHHASQWQLDAGGRHVEQ